MLLARFMPSRWRVERPVLTPRSARPAWWPFCWAALLAALCGWSVVAWWLRWPAAAAPVVAESVAVSASLQGAQLAPVLGAPSASAAAPAAPVPGDLVLSAVVWGGQPQQGAAVIAVNGQPPRPVRVGQALNAQWRLQSLGPREAVLVSPQGEQLSLQLAALKS